MICIICNNNRPYFLFSQNQHIIGICYECYKIVPDYIPPSQAKRFLEIERCKRKWGG
jgi:hypothetical protein